MNHRPYITAITGGIGSGKSVVSRITAAMGYPVYDCDSQAKTLMDTSEEIKLALIREIDEGCVTDGHIDRATLSEIVFNNSQKLASLNSIVHGAVREHICHWIDGCRKAGAQRCFIETAILYESGLDKMVDEVWRIEAPVDMRIGRVMKRSGISREAVLSRIASQDSFVPTALHPLTHIIVNDGDQPLLPQIEKLL